MTISYETIRAYLDLPIAARRALAEKAEGPGYYAQEMPDGTGLIRQWPVWASDAELETYHGPQDVTTANAWIPASEAEVLRVLAAGRPWGLRADHAYLLLEARDEVEVAHERDEVEVAHDGSYDSRLRAAALCCPRDAFGGEG